MTYRERLKLEHPEKVNEVCVGGCSGCPHTYWPDAEEGDKKFCRQEHTSTTCRECWDREIPGTGDFGSIVFSKGPSVRITKYEIREDSTDCLIVNFKSETGGWYTYKYDRSTGESFFVQVSYSCVISGCDIKKAEIKDYVNGVHVLMVREVDLYPKHTLTPMEVEYMKRDLQLTKDALEVVKKKYVAEKKRNKLPGIKNVIFNNPATIVFWDDGSKTVVKANGEDAFTPEVGLAMAISKRALGNSSSYFDEFKKWCKDENNNLITKDEHTQMKIDAAISVLEKVLIYANKPLKKDLEAAIDTALCHLTDISDSYRIYYPKEG